MLVRGEIEPAHAVTNQRDGVACLSEAIADIAGRIRFILYDETTHPAANARHYGCAAHDLGGDEASRIAGTRHCHLTRIYWRTVANASAPKLMFAWDWLIGEFHFGSIDSGLFWEGLVGVGAESEHGPAYARYSHALADNPDLVGTHWFQYITTSPPQRERPIRRCLIACSTCSVHSGGLVRSVRPSRRPLHGLLRMRGFLISSKAYPHAEERPGTAGARLEARTTAMQNSYCGRNALPWPASFWRGRWTPLLSSAITRPITWARRPRLFRMDNTGSRSVSAASTQNPIP